MSQAMYRLISGGQTERTKKQSGKVKLIVKMYTGSYMNEPVLMMRFITAIERQGSVIQCEQALS